MDSAATLYQFKSQKKLRGFINTLLKSKIYTLDRQRGFGGDNLYKNGEFQGIVSDNFIWAESKNLVSKLRRLQI